MVTLLMAAVLMSAEPTAEQAKLLKVFRQEFIHVTPGQGKFPESFTLGGGEIKNQQPPREVKLTGDFYIARYEVPQNLYEAVMGENPSKWKGERNSVEMLDFQDAQEFCRRATRLMRAADLIQENQEIRLPSEAEWEYTARAGTDTVYSFGDDVKDLDDYGWHHGNAAGNDPPVGAKKPNAWGLYDVHGYLWEWCLDDWHDSYEGAPKDSSPRSTEDKSSCVLRGGSWKDEAPRLASRYRLKASRKLEDDAVGFRCVLDRSEK